MNSEKLPAGYIVGRRLMILALAAAVLVTFIWFIVTKVQTGEVEYWYYEFSYRQESLFYSVFYAWTFPWD